MFRCEQQNPILVFLRAMRGTASDLFFYNVFQYSAHSISLDHDSFVCTFLDQENQVNWRGMVVYKIFHSTIYGCTINWIFTRIYHLNRSTFVHILWDIRWVGWCETSRHHILGLEWLPRLPRHRCVCYTNRSGHCS